MLVPIFLRGGADGLNMAVPHGDAEYYALRRTLAIPRPGRGPNAALDLDGRFGLHPALAAWHPLYREGRLAVLHAVGRERNTRSHFEEQDAWETARPNELRADGWLNRYLALHDGSGPIRAISIGGDLPRILQGAVPVQAVRRLEELRLQTGNDREARTTTALRGAYAAAGGALADRGAEALEALRVLGAIDPARYVPAPNARYPEGDLAQQLRQAAQLIKADIGLEVLELELGGWDTHQNQGAVDGEHARLMRTLAEAVAAFVRDLEALATEILVVTVSEFGRTAAENGTLGTDHGHGNCVFAVGAGLAGGQVHGRWPGLARAALHEGRDLVHTTDYRAVIRDVLVHHMGCPDIASVLPRWSGPSTGLFRA